MPTRLSRPLAVLGLVAGVLATATCGDGGLGPGAELPEGTWGGDDAGMIVTGANAHVHFGCTSGDFPSPIELDEDGRFTVTGEYDPDVSPVAGGPRMPAELAGVVRGRDMTMTVAVNDTIQGRIRVFGPVDVRLGHEPEMRMCPICEAPTER